MNAGFQDQVIAWPGRGQRRGQVPRPDADLRGYGRIGGGKQNRHSRESGNPSGTAARHPPTHERAVC